MRPTVSTSVPDRSVDPEDKAAFEYFVNRELRPALKEMRIGLNARGIERTVPLASAGAGAYVTLWTSAVLPNDCAWLCEAAVSGVGATQRAVYQISQAFVSIGGVCTMPAAQVALFSYESAAACDALFAIDAVNRVATLTARDNAAEAMTWTAVIRTHEGTS